MGRARGCQPLSSPGRPRPGPGGLDSLSRKQHTPPDPELLVPGPAYTGQLMALSQRDRPSPPRPRQDGPAGGAAARPDISHLLAPTVEGRLHLPPGLGHVAFLQEGKIVRVLEGDFELLVVSLFQGVQEVLGEPSFGNETRALKEQRTSGDAGVGWERGRRERQAQTPRGRREDSPASGTCTICIRTPTGARATSAWTPGQHGPPKAAPPPVSFLRKWHHGGHDLPSSPNCAPARQCQCPVPAAPSAVTATDLAPLLTWPLNRHPRASASA